ncbi:MAG: nitroreductase family protein, partial [Bacteroidales bacterium]|nr:nitroreductase family protein [Bacteroidales bacterium]MDY6170021.1 nitroreductase family protein [Candidatus Cryptobacteroides sp.]
GLSYRKIKGTYTLSSEERIACYIALGYGLTPGVQHKGKSLEDISNADSSTPQWFNDGVKAALLAPTAVNQQKFYIEYKSGPTANCQRCQSGSTVFPWLDTPAWTSA